MEACHGPGGKTDNRLSNLRWATRSENLGADKRRDGTMAYAKLNEAMVPACLAPCGRRELRGHRSRLQRQQGHGVERRQRPVVALLDGACASWPDDNSGVL